MSDFPDFDRRQQVEGFASVLSDPNRNYMVFGNGKTPDFRGVSRMAMTRDWARPSQADEPPLVWLTAPVPQAVDTTFAFIGESANLPENQLPPNRATLYVDAARALTFELGMRQPKTWIEGEWALDFLPKQVNATVDGHHRQMYRGVAGIYRLAVPGRILQAGQPVRIRIELDGPRTDATSWFGVRCRTDALVSDERTNAEQIQRLQEELIHLKRVVGALARRSYPELFPERLRTEDVIIYTDGMAHVHPPDVMRLQNGDLLCGFREAGSTSRWTAGSSPFARPTAARPGAITRCCASIPTQMSATARSASCATARCS